MEISKPHAPKDAPFKRGRKSRPLRIAVEALEVGQAITVVNYPAKNPQSTLTSVANAVGKTFTPRRKYSVNKMGEGEFQITRKE